MLYDMIYLLTAIGVPPGGSSTVHIYTQTIHRTTQNKEYTEQQTNFLNSAGHAPSFQLYPGICLTTEEKARKNLSQGRKPSVLVPTNIFWDATSKFIIMFHFKYFSAAHSQLPPQNFRSCIISKYMPCCQWPKSFNWSTSFHSLFNSWDRVSEKIARTLLMICWISDRIRIRNSN
jgi:hypothetical protein